MIQFPKDPTESFSDGSLVVEVFRGTDDRSSRPVYSVRAGKRVEKRNDQGEVTETFVAPFIRVFQDRGSLAQARIQAPFARSLGELLLAAEDWILLDMQRAHEEYLEQRREREQTDSSRGIRPTRRTGKTERDREKRRRRQSA